MSRVRRVKKVKSESRGVSILKAMEVYFSRLHKRDKVFKVVTKITGTTCASAMVLGFASVEWYGRIILWTFGVTVLVIPYIMAILIVSLKAIALTVKGS
jgi:hypothetical protein